MARFSKPEFAIRNIPRPPRALALPKFLLAAAALLKAAVARIGGFSLGAYIRANPLLVFIRTQEAVIKENIMKIKLRVLAAIPVPPVPLELLQVDLQAIRDYREQTLALLNDAQEAVASAQSAAQSAVSSAQGAVSSAQGAVSSAQAAASQVTGG